MEVFALSFVVVLVSIAGLGLGVIFGRRPLRGSCGGLACIKGIDCGACKRRSVADVDL